MADFRLLGPVEIWANNRRLPTGQPRQRAVLAALLVDAGRSVTPQTLLDRVWGDSPPRGARQSLHAHVTRIRQVLHLVDVGEPPVLVWQPGGYVLKVAADRVDVHRFRRLLAQAKEPECPDARRAPLLREALALWRGEPLAGLSGSWAARTRESWRQHYPEAIVTWAYAELRVANPEPVISRLTELVGDYPLVESVTAVLMRALYAVGRGADALGQYAVIRRRLAEELGVDPGPELRTLHQAILCDDLDAPHDRNAMSVAVRHSTPAQLPPDTPGFVGRAEHLTCLDAHLPGQQPTAASTVVRIVTVSGTAGVGKTALVVHWAHRVARQFPDGNLYVNLRGFEPIGEATAPAEAVQGLLDALGVTADRIPPQPEAQAALYRTLLAGKRILVLLDNARNAEQVRPLLPGAASCLVVVTSRDTLVGLVAAEGATAVRLDLLARGEARSLLAGRLGWHRLSVEPQATNEIVDLCARLPLALSVVAAHAVMRPDVALSVLADELREARGGLDAFAGNDPITNLRSIFSCSYQALGSEAARTFRLIGSHPGTDITVPSAASMSGVPVRQARALLTELTNNHLITEHTAGRYSAHDLLRAYAAELADSLDARSDRDSAAQRVLDHYLHTAHAAARMLEPHRETLTLATPHPGVTPTSFATDAEALAWFMAERSALVATVQLAAATRHASHAWRLAWILNTFFSRQGYWLDQAAIQYTALSAAQRVGDKDGQAHLHRGLGRAYFRLGRHDEADVHLRAALTLCKELGDPVAEARVHDSLGFILSQRGRHQESLPHFRRALELYARAGHPDGYAESLNDLGWSHALLGNHHQSLFYCHQALVLMGRLGDCHGQANVWDSLGYAHHGLGHHGKAIECYRQALQLFQHTGERYLRAETLVRLGDALLAAEEPEQANAAWADALCILSDLGHSDIGLVRARLRSVPELPQPPTPASRHLSRTWPDEDGAER
ncbi:BTAD domain-containing putative transcriptional regulator [Micromonospora rubida]|uniref:BTAD domain-containing putative transcriptional regulator n=1 Tax=Micromonospora rubida TaxID=2697657 RepID=A0ABW7SRW8_9ACTN